MKYKDFVSQDKECDDCPFYDELCKGGWTSGYSGEPIEPRCCGWDDDDDMDELYSQAVDSIRRHEEAVDRRYLREQEEKKKKAEKAKRSRESRNRVWVEQREINALKKRIRGNEKLLSMARGFASATNFANEMFGYKERVEVKKDSPLAIENQKMQARIDELEQIKKEKLKQLRQERKGSP